MHLANEVGGALANDNAWRHGVAGRDAYPGIAKDTEKLTQVLLERWESNCKIHSILQTEPPPQPSELARLLRRRTGRSKPKHRLATVMKTRLGPTT